MTVLVAAASRHGATDEIAEQIGATLADHGLDVEVKKLDQVAELRGYDAFVLGSGIYLGSWLKQARPFLDAHAAELAGHPTWLFASGSITGDPPVADDPRAIPASATRAHSAWGRGGRSAWPAREGDYRDRQAIDQWAAAIAEELHQPGDD